MTTTLELSESMLDAWATDSAGPIALHLKQMLQPVGGAVIFPPTYANIGYNIDELSDGTKVATIDSVGSQANRMEPIFKTSSTNYDDWLVPQIEIRLRDGERRSILDLAHRGGDAVVRASDLATCMQDAFEALKAGNAWPLCAIAPTSLVFGVWDSRGTFEKRPRLVRAVIRAWDVDTLHSAAQFNSIWKALDDSQRAAADQAEKDAKDSKKKTEKVASLSDAGFKDVPSVFRKGAKVPQVQQGNINPAARVLGGIFVKDHIEREVTVNLIALRNLRGGSDVETTQIHKYLLGGKVVFSRRQTRSRGAQLTAAVIRKK